MMQALVLSAAANGVGAWAATVFAYWTGHYFVFGSAFALTLGLILLVPLVLIAMARIDEIAAIAFGRGPRRLIAKSAPLAPATIGENVAFPKVSIHIPAYFEPVEMLKQTLDAVSRLDYPNFECVCIINNTPDPEFWQPIQDHCRTLGERFKFINAEKVQGFKAGALRIAMERTAADAEIIGIIDADYVVQPDWLKDLVPVFADPRVGLVQAPQEHRDGDRLADALHHERRICRVLRHRHGPAQRAQRHHRARHDVPDPPRGDGHGRRLVQRHHLRGHRSRPDHPAAGLADALHQPPLRRGPAARHLRGLQEAAPPLGLWRLPDRQEALAALPARREPAVAGPAPRILAGLAELARRRKPRRGGRDPQPDLGADRGVCRHRHSRQDPDAADHRLLHRLAGAFPGAVSPAGARSRPARCWAP